MTYNELALMFLFIILMTAMLFIAFYFILSYIRDVINPARLDLSLAVEALMDERVRTKEIHDAILTLNATLAQVLIASRRRPSQTTKLPALLPTPSGDEQQ